MASTMESANRIVYGKNGERSVPGWAVASLLACAAMPATEVRTWVFVCPDDTSYVVRAAEDEAWVFRPGSGMRLDAVPGAATRFAHGDTSLVIDGEKAVLSVPGGKGLTCSNDQRRAIWEKAKLDGVDFRGAGNEPPWVLEMRERSRIVLNTDYGAIRVERPMPPGVTDVASKTTRWDAISYNNGRQAVVSLLTGTSISAAFGTDGRITGNAGCNSYFAGYSVSGRAIAVQTPGSTRRACAEPQGIMEQEGQYLRALATSTQYRISGGRLELRNAQGSMVAVFARGDARDGKQP